MKIFIYIIYIIAFAAVIACGKNVNLSEGTDTKPSIALISSEKKMVTIKGGTYKAFFGKDSAQPVRVKTFLLDEAPVTNSEYLKFLRVNPQWTRSRILRLYADSMYLKNWRSDYEIPENVSPDASVTNISWFAAAVYAKSVGKRLPTVDEWEYAAAADEVSENALEKPEFIDFILKSYQKKHKYYFPVKQAQPNFYGVYDLYGKVWEWTEDFNSVMITGESRKDNTDNETLFCAGASVTSSDLRNYAAFIRFAMRGSVKADYCLNNTGFRCAKDIN